MMRKKKVPPLRMRIFLSKNKNTEGNSRIRMAPLKKSEQGQQLSTRGRREYERGQNTELQIKTIRNEDEVSHKLREETDPHMLFDIKSEENSRSSYSDDGSQTRSDIGQISDFKAPNSGASNVLNSLLSLNSFEQALSFRDMVESNWVKLYKERHANLVDSLSLSSPFVERLFGAEPHVFKDQLNEVSQELVKDWPESLRKIALTINKRRQELAESHRIELQNLLKFAEREYYRITQRARLKLFPLIKTLNDLEVYNYEIFVDEITTERNHPQIDKNTKVSHLLARLKHLTVSTRNRQTMEAQSLYVCQKADWEKGWKLFQRRLNNSGTIWSTEFDNINAKMSYINLPIKVEEIIIPTIEKVD